MCLDVECKKSNCKDIKCKRYFLPLIFAPAAAIHPEIFNLYYFPMVVGVSAFILFWNFYNRIGIQYPHFNLFLLYFQNYSDS